MTPALGLKGVDVVTNRRSGWGGSGLVAAAVAAAVVWASAGPPAWGQGASAKAKAARARAKAANANPPARKAPNAADPLRDPAKGAAGGSFHYRLRIRTPDNATLAASYYPGRVDTNTPVVLLVHEKDRSSKDFEDPVRELKDLGTAEHLQSLGYAVLAFDLRGYGANPRRAVADRDWADMVEDLQSAYLFLVDRHNRGELNLAKLGAVAVGEGANLAAAWAYSPGGAVSHEGRVTDLAGLVLVSPMPEGSGYNFSTLMTALATRIPVLLIAGERDTPSHDTLKRVRAGVEKVRLNRVETFPSALHGYKLLKLEPRVPAVIARFLEGTVKLKATDWEPRYNLTPVAYTDILVVRHAKPDKAKAEEDAPKAKAKEKDAPKAKAGADEAPRKREAR